MFLKQHVEVNESGVWCIKDSVLEEYGVKRIKFEQIFAGPVPDFNPSKKLLKAINGKKVKQETLAKFLKRTAPEIMKNSAAKKERENSTTKREADNNLLEEMRKKEIEYKQKKAEEKLALKQKKKEDNVKISKQLKNWYKPKEDLELNDQKVNDYLTRRSDFD